MMCRHTSLRATVSIAALLALFVTLPSTVAAQLVEVTITSPAAGAALRGTTTVSASVGGLGALTVVGVQFKVDGADLGAEDTSSPFSIPWNTTQSTNGSHTLTAVARTLVGAQHTSDPVAVTVDNLAPAVTIDQTAAQSDPTNASPINFTVVFSEPITGFTAADVALSGTAGGTKTVNVTGGPSTFNVAVSGMTNGTVTATIAAGAALDAAGNSSLASASTDNTVTFDATPPSVTIDQAAAQTDPTNASPINFSVVFSEPISGFTAADVALSGTAGGTKTVNVTGGPSTFNVAVSGMTNGTVTATIAAGAALDAAGNSSLASASTDNTVTFDATPPSVTIDQAAAQTDPTNASPINFTVVFSEPISGFTAADVALSGTAGGTKTVNVTGGPSTFNVAVSGMTNGTVTATIAAGAALDAAGNSSLASTSTDNTVTFGTTPPAPPSTPDLAGASDSGVSNADNITNSTAPTFTGTAEAGSTVKIFSDGVQVGSSVAADGSYTIVTSPLGDGPHSITATATDGANQASPPSTPLSVTIDTTSPAVVVTAPAAAATVSGNVAVTANASDTVGVVAVQFQLDAANLGAEVTATPYTTAWDTAAVANGSHTLTAIARDTAGNATTSSPVAVTVANNGVVRIEDTHGAIAFSPSTTWMLGYTGGLAWSGGTAALGFVAGQRATFSFNGTGISWIGMRGPQTGIATVHLDGAVVATVDAYAPEMSLQADMFSVSGLAPGTHTLVVEVTRTKNDASSDYYVVVDAFDVVGGGPAPDTTTPLVTITSPAHWSAVVGTTDLQATASDNVQVAGVRFFVDGIEIGDDTLAPYSTAWNTTTYSDGPHTVTAVARDDAGNTRTSQAITVNVSNTTPLPAATAARFENNDVSIVYTDGIPAPGRPHRWWHGSRSRNWSADISSFNRSAGARATFRFTGTSVRWIGFRSYWAGIARVSIDGGPFTEIDLFIPPCTFEQRLLGCRDEDPQIVVFAASGLATGVEHTLIIEATGTKRGGESCVPSTECSADYAVVVDAIDVGPALVVPVTGTRTDNASPAVSYTGTWMQDSDSGKSWNAGSAAVSDSPGSSAAFTFTGTTVNWVGLRGPATGIARIYLDGALEQEIDTYSPVEASGIIFTATSLAIGSHTIRIEATGTHSAKSTGNLVYVDAFDVRTRFEDLDPSVVFTTPGGGTWALENADKAWSGASANVGTGTAARSLTAGARAEFTFNGTAVSWIGMRGPSSGLADVYLDGGYVSRVDLYSATEQSQAVLLSLTDLPGGQHTLRIDVVGDKNAASTGTIVIVDAFDVALTLPQPPVTRSQDNAPAIAYSGAWTTGARFSFWSGEFARVSQTAGAQATFTFTGTSIRWIGERRRTGGIARVYLDGVLVGDVDTYWWLQDEFQATLFSRTGLTQGTHTLTIEVAGQKRGGPDCPGAPSPACSAGYDVVIDAFDVQ